MTHEAPKPARRRIGYAGDTKSEGRSGCLITGAVLGIVVGVTFAFYGLPPVLRHFYGEKQIAAGAQYVGDAKTISVTRAETTPDPDSGAGAASAGGWFVTVVATTNKTWAPGPADFQLEFEGAGDWLEARALAVDGTSNAGGLALGEEVHIFLTFPVPASKPAAQPLYLHLSDPRVRFALP